MTDHIAKMADDVFTAVSAYVQKTSAPLMDRLKLLEQSIAETPAPKDGAPGKDAEVDYERIAVVLRELVAAIPVPKDGIDGKDGRDGNDGDNGEQGPAGKDGIDGSKGADGTAGKDGAPGLEGKSGDEGREGAPGRDALAIEVLDSIDPERKYQRGTFAHYRGGIVRSFRVSDPLQDGDLEKSGWIVVVNGLHQVAIEQGDDLRSFGMAVETTTGHVVAKTFAMPAVIDRGVFKADASYKRGDAVSWDGSLWIAQSDIEKAEARPSNPAWRLSVKRGNDGKDAGTLTPRPLETVRLR